MVATTCSKRHAVAGGTNAWVWTKRSHEYDTVGRLVASNLKSWNDGGSEPAGDSLEHCYAGSRHIQNYDGSNYGAVWHWAGTSNSHNTPLKSPNADTASQSGYNSADFYTPQRRSFLTPTTEGDKRLLYGQGRPEAKDSSSSGANWYLGTKSDKQVILQPDVESRLFFEGTVTATDMSRATDLREDSRVGILGSALSYRGANGRVASESIGRDLNPLGRGDGAYYFAGGMAFGGMQPFLPARLGGVLGGGNSSNDSDNWAGGTLPAGPPQSGGSPGSGVGGHGGPLTMGAYQDKPGAKEECFPSCTAGRVREPYRSCNGKEQRPNPAFGVKARCCGGPCCQDDVPCLMDWGRGAFETCAVQLGMDVEQAVAAAEKGDMTALAMACKTCPGAGESAIGPGGGVLPAPGCPGGNCGGGGGNYDVFGPMQSGGGSIGPSPWPSVLNSAFSKAFDCMQSYDRMAQAAGLPHRTWPSLNWKYDGCCPYAYSYLGITWGQGPCCTPGGPEAISCAKPSKLVIICPSALSYCALNGATVEQQVCCLAFIILHEIYHKRGGLRYKDERAADHFARETIACCCELPAQIKNRYSN